MKTNRLIQIALLLVIISIGCKKIVTEENPDFIGYWESESMFIGEYPVETIDIGSGGRGDYSSYSVSGFTTKTVTATGKAKHKMNVLIK